MTRLSTPSASRAARVYLRRACCALAAALSFTLAACTSDSAMPENDGAQTLHVGYSEVSAPWRVGAKPGQVGTASTAAHGRLLLRALGELQPIINAPVLDPAAHIENATEWVLGILSEWVDEARPGRYATLFAPGIGIEEPPIMKALVLQRGDTKIALVRADLYIGHEHVHRRVADLVEAETGIDRDHIFFVATHNHSAPHALSPAPGVWILADGFDPRHFVYVTHAIARSIIEADRALRPAVLRTSVTEFRAVQHNIIGPGRVTIANPDGDMESVPVGYPYHHIDPDLASLRFEDPETGEPFVYLFLFGMHPEALPDRHAISSGEWPTHVENKLRERTGIPAVWLPGALGDSEPDRARNNPEHNFMRNSFEAMERMSEIIADAAEQAFHHTGTQPPQHAPRLDQLVADIPGVEAYPVPTSAFLGPRFPLVRILFDKSTVRLHVIRIGDVLLLGAPAEITTDLSFNIKSRVDRVPDNVYQGYEWPDAPDWVIDRVRRNFSTDEVDPEIGAPLPVVVNHVNGYMGYIVSAWEYETRAHYRQEMTAFGAGTADYVASSFVGMARELEGGPRFSVEPSPWHDLDLAGFERIQEFLAALDEQVVAMARDLPATDADVAGNAVFEPTEQAAPGMRVAFTWAGGTNDMEPPSVVVERRDGSDWTTVAGGPSRDVFVYFQAPDLWTAEWRAAAGQVGDVLRFRAEGVYRGVVPNASEPDPIWDPEGKNAPYAVTSATFEIADLDDD